MGVVGLETAFSVLYTHLVKKGVITLERLIELMSINPAGRFGIESGIKNGASADIAVIDLNKEYVIDSSKFLSKGKATPFDNMPVTGKVKMTFVNGNLVYNSED